MPETSSPTIFGGNQELGRGRSPLAVDDEATASADVRRSSEPAALTITGQNLSDNPSCLKKEGSEAMMDNSMKEITGKRQAEQEATHFRQSNDVRASLASVKPHHHYHHHNHHHHLQQSQAIERSD